MKRTAILAATALVASGFVTISTPAFANPPNNHIDWDGGDPDQICEDLLRPHNNSGFETAAVITGTDVNIGSPTIERASAPYQQLPTGTPSFSNFSNHGSFFRNGGSPNVWAIADAGVTTYPSSDLYYEQESVQPTGTTFDCEVWKDPGGPGKGPDAIYPPGLQTTGHATVTGEVRSPAPDFIDPNGGPMQTGGTSGVSILVCISPNTTGGKPGQWRGMHDFPSSGCPAASIAAAGNVPSGNNPD